ncbi:MAG: cell division protein ZapA [Candidatus Electronema aureum]|uniref:Cell division protein ZapA n=1 Tax=Candidatus Electronema aureum TaxID=2005002 RepID=A0A521G0Y3_9BACT|nr:MAG: cell division protein ZapA [Candidatus Electronema aureum]
MDERRISVALFGQEFSFYTDAPDEEVQQAVTLLREELELTGLSLNGNAVPSSTMLVLGCLRLVARCVSQENAFSRFQAERKLDIERKHLISGLTDKVVAVLQG